MMHFFPDEFARLCGRRFAVRSISFRPSNGFTFWHKVSLG
jgi:hypothetical protein